MLLKGKNAIITGCARGIGKSILTIFAENGANIWACARTRTDEFEQYTAELAQVNGVEIIPTYFELTDEEQLKNAVKAIRGTKRPVDILVNNAGITYNALFQMSSMSKMKEVFEVNFFSQMLFTQYISKIMTAQKRGSIVSISSSAALDGNSGRSIYGASKAAVLCATRSIAEELAPYGVRANCIAPGITQTDMLSSMTDETIQQTLQMTKLKRAGKPSEIASAALFLASDLSSYVTGQVLRVDGGF